jgi:hypothetical protein
MASTYSALKIQLMGTGENSGTWGTVTNTNLGTALEEAIVGSADVTFASGTVTLTLTDANSSQTARNLRLNLTGTSGGAQNLIVPAIEKVYIVNNGCADTITVKNTTGTGIAVPAGKTMWVYNNGTNVVDAVTHLTSLTLGTALPIASGGTGSNSTTYANLQSNVSGILPVANGGTGSNTGVNLQTTVSGTLPVANGGSGAITLTGVLKGNGTSAFSAATAGTDFVAPGTATTFTALQTFSGTSSVAASKFTNIKEVSTISATAATGTIAYDVTTQSVLYYTSNASGNFTVNFRGSSGTSLDTIMATGESVSVTFLVTNGATAYYNSAVQVDGSSVTPKWQGGTAPTSGNANSIDSYTYVIIKTGSATFTVLAVQTKFA